MNVVFETTWLAPGGPMAAGKVRVNGQQLIDEVAFFLAASSTFIPRGNLAVEFAFQTKWQFNTPMDAEVFSLMLPTMVPMGNNDNGIVQCQCGFAPNYQVVYMANAVLLSVKIVEIIGLSVTVEYVIRGPGFQTDVPPNVPGYPNPDEVNIVFRRSQVPVPANAVSLTVPFSSPFNTAPVVVAVMCGVSGSQAIFLRLLSDSVTTSQFTVEFSAPTPDSSYFVNYFAVQ